MLIGLLIGGAGLFGLMIASGTTPFLLLVPPLALAGFGMAFTMPAATTAVTDSAPGERAGLASGVINAARQVGSVIGIAVLRGLVGGTSDVAPSLRLALAIAGGAFLAGAAVTACAVTRRTPAQVTR